MAMNQKLLTIYLNDHLAGSVAAYELAKRCRSSNRGTRLGSFLDGFMRDLEDEQELLRDLIRSFEGRPDRVKGTGAWVAEKVGRLKLNGQLTGYSPLSRLLEVEGLRLGVEGKLSLWRALKDLAPADSRLATTDFDALIKRAETHRDELEAHRVEAAERAFAG